MKDEKYKLENYTEEKVKGILLRSKAKWIEVANRKSKSFANVEIKLAEHKNKIENDPDFVTI